MLQFFLVLLVLGIVINICEFLWNTVRNVGKWLIIGVVIILYLRFWNLTIPATIILAILYKIRRTKEENEIRTKKERQRARNKAWLESNQAELTEYQVDEIFSPIVDQIYIRDSNEYQNKFTRKDIPYGRVNAFLNYFERSIYTEEPYYFSSVPSLDENEFREYGFLITRNGIFVSKQYKNSSDDSLHVKNEFFSFSGLKTVSISGRTVSGTRIVNQSYDEDGEQIVLPASISDSTVIKDLCQNVVDSKVSTALFTNSVISDTEVEDRAWEAQEQLKQKIDLEYTSNLAGAASIGSSRINYDKIFAENKHLMNGKQGHGYAAEYGNNTIDRLLGKNVKNLAQDLDEHGRQVKSGADRMVDGQEIQTKFYQDGKACVNAVFEDGHPIYLRSDGSGKMIDRKSVV